MSTKFYVQMWCSLYCVWSHCGRFV